MLSPRDRYCSDVNFHRLVDLMLHEIIQCHYTPSEMRDAALLASIKYEETHIGPRMFNKDVINWLNGEER